MESITLRKMLDGCQDLCIWCPERLRSVPEPGIKPGTSGGVRLGAAPRWSRRRVRAGRPARGRGRRWLAGGSERGGRIGQQSRTGVLAGVAQGGVCAQA